MFTMFWAYSINSKLGLKKVILSSGCLGAGLFIFWFLKGGPFLPEGWNALVENPSVALTLFGWLGAGFFFGSVLGAIVCGVVYAFKMTRGNWTRLGR